MTDASMVATLRQKFRFLKPRLPRSIRAISRGGLLSFFRKRDRGRVRSLRLWFRIRSHVILRRSRRLSRVARRREVRVWIDGEETFPRILKLINKAQHTIAVQMFIWKDDALGRRMAAALLRAAERGVKIDIVKEVVGDVFELSKDFATTAEEKGMWERFWQHPNITISQAYENNHAKVFVIDDQILLIGGMNIADEQESDWHDFFVELRGERFVHQYLTGGEMQLDAEISLVMNSDARKDVRPCIETLIRDAKHWIFLEHAYVSDAALLKLLAARTRDGVRVTLIIPKDPDVYKNANLQSVEYLMSHANPKRLQVLLYPGMAHGKLMLIDRSVLFVGSANLTTSSIDTMGEVNVMIRGRNRRVLWKMREATLKDIVRSTPIVSPPKLQWIGRLLAILGL